MNVYQFFCEGISFPVYNVVADSKYIAIVDFEIEFSVNFKAVTADGIRKFAMKELRIEGYKIVKEGDQYDGKSNIRRW